jgi:ubiquinone/menaquinone biosynthesis C-methylase UbiE
VLDLGCGRGAVLFAAAEAVGPDGYAVGIDLSPNMVHATAAEIAARRLRNLVVRVDDAEDPGFPTGSFEAVLAGLMLFITPDPAAVLASAHRLLAPGGRFALTSFGPADPAWEGPVRAALAFAEPQQSVRDWTTNKGGNGLLDTPEQIAALLEQAGFGDVETEDDEDVAVYRDPEHWWASVWNSGRRAALLELIPAERIEDARKAAFAELEPLSGDGGLTRRSVIRYTTATRV